MFQRQVAEQTLRGNGLGDSHTQSGPKHVAQKIDCTVLFARTNNTGTFISCATPKTCSPGVHFRVRTAPIHTQGGEGAWGWGDVFWRYS